jgi:uncharacterized protein YdbL (DUF1318 family)
MSNRSASRFSLPALVLSLVVALPALALDLQSAKEQALIGETASGYLVAIKPSSEVNALIEDINKQRKTYYQKIAGKNGISLEAVEVRAGKKAIEKTPSGQMINTGSGWTKK